MKKFVTMLLTLCMATILVGCDSDSKDVKVGVIQYAEHPALDQAYKGFKAELKKAGYDTSKVINFKNAQGDQSNCDTIASTFVNDNDDLVYAIATPAAQAIANKTKDIPVVVSAVTDPKDAGLVKSNKKPGTNVTGASDLTPVNNQLKLLKQLLPNAKTVGIMYCNAESNSIVQAKLAKAECDKLGLKYVEATVTDSNQIQQVTESLIGKVDAIYIPTDNLLAEGMATVAQVANENNMPCIVGEAGMVENGGLATYGIDYYALGKMAGKMAVKILQGKAEPKDMAIQYLPSKDCQLTINKTVAAKFGITIPKDLDAKADYIESK